MRALTRVQSTPSNSASNWGRVRSEDVEFSSPLNALAEDYITLKTIAWIKSGKPVREWEDVQSYGRIGDLDLAPAKEILRDNLILANGTRVLQLLTVINGRVDDLVAGQSFREHPATALLPDRRLIHVIACSHELGHQFFGHGSQVALDYCMRVAGGFGGNGQTLLLLARLENFSASAGASQISSA